MAVVEVVNSGYSRDKDMMHLLRCLFFISEHHHFLVEAVHLPGKINVAADALSHNNISIFTGSSRGTGASNTSPRSGTTATGSRATGLDVKQWGRTVCSLYQAGLAPSTQKAYSAGKKRYMSFCGHLGLCLCWWQRPRCASLWPSWNWRAFVIRQPSHICQRCITCRFPKEWRTLGLALCPDWS